jgi:outer membrane lipoprotein SlyB
MTGHLPGSNAEPAAAPQAAVAPAPVAAARTETAEHRAAEREREREHARNQQHTADASAASRAQARPVCANCGVVESVNLVEQKGEGGAVGMVGGGVAGALVGSQIGHGTGKTIAEVAGAAGGAYVGNEIQKQVTATKHYNVVVRLENGSAQTISYPTQPAFSVGSRVRVENGALVLI